jgi:hypothetical protein
LRKVAFANNLQKRTAANSTIGEANAALRTYSSLELLIVQAGDVCTLILVKIAELVINMQRAGHVFI